MEKSKVTVSVALHVQVAQFIHEKGFFVGSSSHNSIDITSMIVLRRVLRWKIKLWSKFEPGILWLENEGMGATKKNWILSVYGSPPMEAMETLAKHIAEKFDVHVHVRQESMSTRVPEPMDGF
jgi:hypothetical protein